jgi:cholest-4-en-3-one 26-monooxygenase
MVYLAKKTTRRLRIEEWVMPAAEPTTKPVPNLPPGFDFTDPDIYAERLPVEELAEMRRTAPIWWNEQAIGVGGFDDGGFWVVSKHGDVKEISRRSDVFSSLQKTALPRYKEGTVTAQIDTGKFVLLNMDAPQHTRLRKIISRGFTPRAVERLREDLKERAQRIVEAAAAEGSGDFVEQVSCELPLQAIAGLMGVPQEDRKKLFHWSNEMVGDQDPEFARNDAMGASVELITYAMQLAAARSNDPQDDIVTKLIEADIEGHKLSDDEFGFFVILLAVAGNETTRNSITQGMMAFTDFPDQWELYKRERPVTAADEIVRWATPVTSFQRTALEDYELSGVQIKKGQRVVMVYRSANFDEEVFDDPFTFNILRDPNPHVGFGGTGAHYCVGANLARMTIDLMFNAIADTMPNLEPLAKPERLRSGWLNGIKHWQVDYSGNGAAKRPVTH